MVSNLRIPRRVKLAATITMGILIAANLAISVAYANRAYPLTQLNNQNIGGYDRVQLAKELKILQQSYQLTLRSPATSQTYSATQLGIDFTSETTLQALTTRQWYELPIIRLWQSKPDLAPVIDQSKLRAAIDTFAKPQKIDPTSATASFTNDKFVITPDQAGRHIDPTAALHAAKQAITKANSILTLKPTTLAPDITRSEAEPAIKAANAILALDLKLTHESQTYTPAPQVIASWLQFQPAADQQSLIIQVDKARIAAYVATIASELNTPPVTRIVTVSNGVSTETTPGQNGRRLHEESAVSALAAAIEQRQATTTQLQVTTVAFTTSTQQAKTTPSTLTYRYCIALKGVDASHQAGFAQEVARVYADSRGWSLGGKIRFSQVSSGCTYTVWLAAADQVPSFSPAGCSAYYSCRVGPNVIINFDRYMGATPSWTLSLTDYRSMVVNHETGHWLGFDHLYCSGPGQPAPVMQQQSISLQGCTANPWPTQSEKHTVAQARGL